MSYKNPIQVAGRLFGALEYLAKHGEVSLLELTDALELNKSTVHRLLSSLQYMGYVRQKEENGRYVLTYKIVNLSGQVLSQISILDIARPHLRQLMKRTGETIHFVKREGEEVVYIDKVESHRNSVQMVSRIGSRIPLYSSSVGKAIAAELPFQELKKVWDGSQIRKLTDYTITDFDAFLKELEKVRQQGYALDNEENEMGVRCIGTSLSAEPLSADYAFSISAPVNRMGDDRIEVFAKEILQTREKILRDVNGSGGSSCNLNLQELP